MKLAKNNHPTSCFQHVCIEQFHKQGPIWLKTWFSTPHDIYWLTIKVSFHLDKFEKLFKKTWPSTTLAVAKEISSNVRNHPSDYPKTHSESFIGFGHQKVEWIPHVFAPILLNIHYDDPIFLLNFRVYCMCRRWIKLIWINSGKYWLW